MAEAELVKGAGLTQGGTCEGAGLVEMAVHTQGGVCARGGAYGRNVLTQGVAFIACVYMGSVLAGAWLIRGVATKGRGFGGLGMDCLKSIKLSRAGWVEA